MFDTQTDLLSYAHLHSDVDQLFRAYLDTALMELAQTYPGDQKQYWSAVVDFRRQKLSYPDPPIQPKPGTAEPSIKELINAMPTTDQPVEALQYLYWFEVRSDFWSRATQEELATLAGVLPPSRRLELFYSEARELERRIEKLEQLRKVSGGGEWAVPKGTISVDPLPQKGFEALLAKVVSPTGRATP